MAVADKEFLAQVNAKRKNKFTSIDDFLTNNGKLKKGDDQYDKRLARLQNARGVTKRTNIVLSGGLMEEARKLYGSAADLYNIPELKGLFEQAFINKWTAADLLREIDNTEWAKSRTAAQESWDVLRTVNPVEADAAVASNMTVVRRILSGKGITATEEQIKTIAEKGSRSGWNGNQWDEYAASEAINMSQGGAQPAAGTQTQLTTTPTAAELRTIAKNFGVPVGDTTLNQWVADISSNNKTADQFNEYARASAQTLYPSIADRLQTSTFDQITAPYKQLYAQVLEVPEDNIDFTSPTLAPLFNAGDPAKPRLMNSTEWVGYLRKKPEWQNTQNAYREYADVANTLNKIFGGTR